MKLWTHYTTYRRSLKGINIEVAASEIPQVTEVKQDAVSLHCKIMSIFIFHLFRSDNSYTLIIYTEHVMTYGNSALHCYCTLK
jgi:hypothetical protein